MQILMRPWGHMHFVDEGPKDASAIVFANSLGTDLRMWQGVTELLPQYRRIRFDMRGHGLSATPQQDWTIEEVAADVMVLLDSLGIETAVIAGCSVGGMVAQAVGIHHSSRVRALILSNTAAKIGTLDSWQARITAIQSDGIASIADAILQHWFAKSFVETAQVLPWRIMLLRTDPAGYSQTCRALSQADFRVGAAGLNLPVMCIAGSEDLATPTALVSETAAIIRGAQWLELQGSGHIPAIDAPDVTARVILNFLESLDV